MLGRPSRWSQTGYVFLAIAVAGATGLLLLSVQALTRPGFVAGWRFLFIGGLAAIAGLGAGGLVGLIFGLPESSSINLAAPSTKSEADPASAASASDININPGDWYRDSSSLERIATWLTGAIIALSLANFDNGAARFRMMSQAIGLTMLGSTSADLELVSSRVDEAAATLRAVTRLKGETSIAFEQRKRTARDALNLANATAIRATSEAEVPGGLLLGGYALLGFAASYLWTRRYLPAELASARRDMRQISRLDARDAAELASARASKLTQAAPKSATLPGAAAAAVSAAQTAGAGAGLVAAPALIPPGSVRDDPWKGQFGGLSSNSLAQIVASVRQVSGHQSQFLVSISIRALDGAARTTLAGTEARIYLHPTFPEPVIRPMMFNPSGVIDLTLAAVGAFTLGVQLLATADLLELDLANLREAPAAFRLN